MNDFENTLVREALANYNLDNTHVNFIRHNENITCRVCSGNDVYVLRIQCPADGFSLKIFGNQANWFQLMYGEMELLVHLEHMALFPVQIPLLTNKGDLACSLSDGSPACLLKWIDGETLTTEDGDRYAHALGELAAHIHMAAKGFAGTRLSYSHDLIQAMQEEINVAFQANHITLKQASICRGALVEINSVMTCLDAQPNSKGLIHADLGFSNVLWTPKGLTAIDFSLSGYGYKAQECGMITSNYQNPEQRKSVIDGYSKISGSSHDPHHIDAFFAFSILLFITCQHERFSHQIWFSQAMDRWCNTCFTPLTGADCQL